MTDTLKPIGPVEVTQADRDAADAWKREWQNCRGEHTALVQAFARHRIEHTRTTASAGQVEVEIPHAGGKRLVMKPGAPEIALLCRAIFRSYFADDEDEAAVVEKYNEWPEAQAKAIRAARYVLSALGGNGAVCKALSQPPERDALVEALEFIADLPDPGADEERSATFYRVHAAMLKQVASKALGRQTVSQEALDWAGEWANSDEGRAAPKEATQ